jgi:Zn finger protein HypA/HybF involved in hydrogenase expression
MASTFEKFNGKQAGNYCTNPRLDVEILPDVHHCETCQEVITYVKTGKAYPYGEWRHSSEQDHKAEPKLRCRYCHNENKVKFTQEAYYDRTFCPRCEGVTGYGIGD